MHLLNENHRTAHIPTNSGDKQEFQHAPEPAKANKDSNSEGQHRSRFIVCIGPFIRRIGSLGAAESGAHSAEDEQPGACSLP